MRKIAREFALVCLMTLPVLGAFFMVQACNRATATPASIAVPCPVSSTSCGPGVLPGLFGMHVHSPSITWPTIPVGVVRIPEGTTAYWATLEPSANTYNWSNFDNWITEAQTKNVSLIYTVLGVMPTWASQNPTDPSNLCAVQGTCFPPIGLNADGTGDDSILTNFIDAMMAEDARVDTTGVLKGIGCANEPNGPNGAEVGSGYWQGTHAQLVRMCRDLYQHVKAANPTMLVISPEPSKGVTGPSSFFQAFLADPSNPLQYIDVIGLHGYSYSVTPGVYPNPEDLLSIIGNARTVIRSFKGGSPKPIWVTEDGWGDTSGNGFTDQDLHAAYISRKYILAAHAGVGADYWFAWDNSCPTSTTCSGLIDSTGNINAAGIAYGQVESWLTGTRANGGCFNAGTIWTCPVIEASGVGLIAWNDAGSCSGGVCTTFAYTVPQPYSKQHDIAGNTTAISGSTVQLGIKPLLLDGLLQIAKNQTP
jgi:hypothetical protein